MRTFAIIFFGVGFYFLLRRVDFAFQIIPLRVYGSEGGLIEIAIDTIFGGGAALVALLFAFIHFMRARQAKFARVLLASCCVLLLGFIGSLCL